jgi:hypothetical protein
MRKDILEGSVSKMCKCKFPDGVEVKIGDLELDPCKYEVAEIHKNVTVEVLRCKVCGHLSMGWRRQNNTEDIIMEDIEEC